VITRPAGRMAPRRAARCVAANARKPTVREVYAMAGGTVVTGRWELRGSWRIRPVTATRTS
jgi:hypothetical protein